MSIKLTSLLRFGALLMISQVNAATIQISPANSTTIVGGRFELSIHGLSQKHSPA